MRGRIACAAAVVAVVAATAGCREEAPPPTALTAADTADQVIFGLSHYLTAEGVLRARLEADTAYLYQGAQSADLLGVKVTFYSPEGVTSSTLTARAGTYQWRTGNMEATGDVVAVTPDGRRLTTSVLEFRRTENQIVGSAPFVFDSPDRHLEGASFTSDPDFRNVVTQSPRRGTSGTVRMGR